MSMTREEAIKAFEEIKANAQNKLGKKYAAGCERYYQDKIDLADAALSALRPITREQVETKLKAEWVPHKKNDDFSSYYTCSKCGAKFGESCGIDFFERDFCPMCGSPVTDNGVDEVKKRLEEMQND